MKPIILAGPVLIVLAHSSLPTNGVTHTTRQTVLQIGFLEATMKTKKTVPKPPVLGALALAGNVAFVLIGVRE